MQAESLFSITAYVPETPHLEQDGITMSRANLSKSFTGDLSGTSSVDMLATRTDSGGAGYVAMERIEGTLQGKKGSFVLLHMGTMSSTEESGNWPIVPGSGTGELAGISGSAVLNVDEDQQHHFSLTYEL